MPPAAADPGGGRRLPAAGQPRVTILIPCYERPDELRLTLTALRAIDYPDRETIVVDDCSPTVDIAGVVRDFPGVTYHRMPANGGYIAARNHGASLATGTYLLNLDDDSWPVGADALARAVAWMEADPRIGVLAFTIHEAGDPAPPPLPDTPPVPSRTYIGCGNLYRLAALREVGPYVESFRAQREELERCLRLWDRGWRVMHARGLVVHHLLSAVGRDNGRINAFNLLNRLRIELLRTPLPALPLGLVRTLAFAVRRRRRIDFARFRQEYARAGGISAAWRARAPVRWSTWARWRALPAEDLVHRGDAVSVQTVAPAARPA